MEHFTRLQNAADLHSLREKLIISPKCAKRLVRICACSFCAKEAGKLEAALIAGLRERSLEREVTVVRAGSLGLIGAKPSVVFEPGELFIQDLSCENVREIISLCLGEKKRTSNQISITLINSIPFFNRQERVVTKNIFESNPNSIYDAIAKGRYLALAKALSDMTPIEVIEEVDKSALRGRGGVGFPTGRKWKTAAEAPGTRKFVIANGEEGEPALFKDRLLLEILPHQILEGLAIAAYAVGAKEAILYIRHDLELAIDRFQNAIQEANKLGLLGENILGSKFSLKVSIVQSSGGYICGEETALIEDIEGNRPMPRSRPPFPAVFGLWGSPTVVNNVETLANIPAILLRGHEWFQTLGVNKQRGTKLFCLSGDVKQPGLIELPLGTNLKSLIFEIGGGMKNDYPFHMALVGGLTGGVLPAENLDIPIQYGILEPLGATMGAGGIEVYDDRICAPKLAQRMLSFLAGESCGKCVPCRIGTTRMLEIWQQMNKTAKRQMDTKLFQQLADVVGATSLCGLGQAAANVPLSVLKYFEQEIKNHRSGSCPACNKKDGIHNLDFKRN